MEEVEIWKEIPQFNSKYLASNSGRIKSIPYKGFRHGRASEKILSTTKRSKDGYALINLITPEGIRKMYQVHRLMYQVHRLVGITFVEGYQEGLIINHINEVKDDNRASNLEWVTEKINDTYNNKAIKTGIVQRNKHLSKPIGKYDLELNLLEVYPSVREAERLTGIKHENMSNCALNKAKTAGGYKWKY